MHTKVTFPTCIGGVRIQGCKGTPFLPGCGGVQGCKGTHPPFCQDVGGLGVQRNPPPFLPGCGGVQGCKETHPPFCQDVKVFCFVFYPKSGYATCHKISLTHHTQISRLGIQCHDFYSYIFIFTFSKPLRLYTFTFSKSLQLYTF